MSGKGRHRVLAVTSPDPLLSFVASIGLATSAGTALVIDLERPPRSGARTLADIVAEGPRLEELSPGRGGVALMGGGPVEVEVASEAVERLAQRWPAVVVRDPEPRWHGPTVPVVALYPGWLAPTGPEVAVWQPLGIGSGPPGPGPVLPPLSRNLIHHILRGRLPGRSRWLRAWDQVWEMPWA
jgi:hypothetical protein